MKETNSEPLPASLILSLVIPEEQIMTLAKVADQNEKTITQVIQDAITAYLDTPVKTSMEDMLKRVSIE